MLKIFGAMGDGEHDDTPSFLQALSVATKLYIPEGTYRITKEIEIPKGMIISGAGEVSILKIESEIGIITTSANTVIKDLKIVGNDENTALKLFKNKQIVKNVIFEHFKVGCINKNSDYIGTVKFVDLSFDYVKTCFESNTLTNGVSFNRIVAYRFDCILKAYWIEGNGFNNCFFEIGNEGSVIVDVPEGKSNCRAMSLSFNSCYIENVTQLLSKVVAGVVKFDNCWLYTKKSFYDNPTGANSLKLLFSNCSFSVPNGVGNKGIIFNLSSYHTITIINPYGLVNGVGAFDLKAGVNIVGGIVNLDNKSMKQTKVTATTNTNGAIKTGLLTTKHRLLCTYGYVKDGSSNVLMIPYMSGDNWYVVCKNPGSDALLSEKEIEVRMVYTDKTNIEEV